MSDSYLKIELGQRFRGLRGVREFPVNARKITVLPDTAEAYALIPPEGTPQLPPSFKLETFLLTLIKSSDVTSEIVLTNEDEFAALLHALIV